MGMNLELAPRTGVRGGRRRNRWYGLGVSGCLAQLETSTAPRKQPVNWNKVLGLAISLLVVALGWSAVGFAVAHFLR